MFYTNMTNLSYSLKVIYLIKCELLLLEEYMHNDHHIHSDDHMHNHSNIRIINENVSFVTINNVVDFSNMDFVDYNMIYTMDTLGIILILSALFLGICILTDYFNLNHYKKMPIIISIEGNIGTGKSTLINKVQLYFNKMKLHIKDEHIPRLVKIGYIAEPVDVWNSVSDDNGVTILEKYYENQKKYAFPFQMMAYISRLSIMREVIKQDYDIIIMERSMFTDREVFAKMLYDDNKIEPIEYNIYMKWFNEFIGDFPNIWHIYIQAEPSVSAARVVKRGRQGETIPLSYLESCHAYHEKWLLGKQEGPVLLLDGNKEMNDEDYNEWLYAIEHFISKNM